MPIYLQYQLGMSPFCPFCPKYRFYHEGQYKFAFISDAGGGKYVFTSMSENMKTFFTHMQVSAQYLKNLGITLKSK
jgi:hypothetical protein